ncbi:hypothetical protein ACFE04_005439 [Oxalis oulophora]
MRRFFWSNNSEKSICAVRWGKVILSKHHGGLGIGSILEKNKALLFKWLWGLTQGSHDDWARVIASKYLKDKNLILTPALNNARQSFIFKCISSFFFDNNGVLISLAACLKCKVGDGHDISFWSDYWTSNATLKTLFPRLFSLSTKKEAKINEMGFWLNESWSWEFQ